MRRSALKNMIKIILLGCCLILAALGAALYIGQATPSYEVITASAAPTLPTQRVTCPQCGEMNAERVGTGPTCTKAGSYTTTCPDCGYSGKSYPAALGHNEVTKNKDASCTLSGYKNRVVCSRCSLTISSGTTIPALGHSYGSYIETTAPTCTAAGEETRTCIRCGDKEKRSVDALGHNPVSDDVAATCTSSGTSGRKVCSRCGTVTSSGTTVSALGHSYSWTTTSSATCTSGGTQRGTCSRCGDTTTRSTSAFGHNMYSQNHSATCTSGGYTYYYCGRSGCSYHYTANQTSALGHNYGNYTTTKAPTCTATGTETATCSRCSATTSRTLSALGHSPVTDAAVEATCTTAGKTEGSHCSRCAAVITAQETVPALGHDLIEHEAQAPTCTAIGWAAYETCSRCGYTTYEEIAATGHTPGAAATCTTAQTCTECGAELAPAKGHTPGAEATCTTAQTCTVCGAELAPAKGHTPGAEATCTTAQICTVCGTELTAALGHDPVTDPAEPATCTTPGKTEGSHCSRCDAVLTAQQEIPAPGHDWGEYIETTAPTCTAMGVETATCTVCGAETTRTIAALGHSPVTDAAIPATCTETGLTAGSHCSRCETVIKAQQTVPALGHAWGEYVETTPATCTTAGEETSTCTRCQATQTRSVDALGHDPVTDAAVAATCTTAGKTEGSHCSRCDAVLTAQQEIPALGHAWGEYVETTPATCTTDGIETSTCTRCYETQTRSVDALGHDPVTDAAVSATCTTAGKTEGSHCSRCDAVLTAQQTVPALGHAWGEYVETTPATCTETGIKTSTCTRCQETRTQSIPAKGHTLGPDATCTEDQVCTVCGAVISAAEGHIPGPAATCTTAQTCSVCGTVLVAALGHDLVEHAAQTPTCTEIGWAAYETCSRCDYTTYEEIAATGHTPGAEATCTTAQTCTACGTVLTAALGHDLIEHEAQAPTCTAIGWAAYETCSRCDYTTYEEIAATGHTPGAEATCTTAQTCTVCGAELAPAKGHTPGAAATCTTAQTCTACGAELVPAKGHTPGAEATCTTAQTCTVCGAELAPAKGHTPGAEATCTTAQICTECGIELTAALGHVSVIDEATAPTCMETGLEAGAHCSRCGEILLEQAEIPALGHQLLPVEDDRTDCTQPGTQTRRCSRCDYAESVEVAGGSHSWRPGEILRESTCSVAGVQQIVCVFCGTIDEVELPRTSHKVITTDEVPATCDKPGMTGGIMCAVCGKEMLGRSEIPALGHSLAFVPGVDATATTDGMIEHYKCTTCNGLFADAEGTRRLTDTDLVIPATGEEPGTDDPDEPGTDDPAPDQDAGLEPWQWACIIAACVAVKIVIVAAIVAAVKAKKHSAPAAKAKQKRK